MIALYRGKSLFPSRLIEFINWSPYSHASFIHEFKGSCVEAWTKGGVTTSPNFGVLHTPGTVVDLFRVRDVTLAQEAQAYNFCVSQIGKKYDYWGIVHFITRHSGDDESRWFCSELVFEAYRLAGVDLLLRIEAHQVYPGMLAISPRHKSWTDS